MRAQKFAETSANLFLFGLPLVVIGIPAIALAVGSLPLAAQPILRALVDILAVAGYIGLPCLGLAGAGAGLWCHFRKNCGYKLWKPVLVLAVLAIYIVVAVIAVRTYRSMRHEGGAGAALLNPAAHARADAALAALPCLICPGSPARRTAASQHDFSPPSA